MKYTVSDPLEEYKSLRRKVAQIYKKLLEMSRPHTVDDDDDYGYGYSHGLEEAAEMILEVFGEEVVK